LNTASRKFAGCSRFSKCLIFLTILLVLISAIAQAVHFHRIDSANELKNCAVCQLAAATALAILVIAVQFVRRQQTFAICDEKPQAGSVVAFFTLFSRPPPVA
jgi:membrane protein YdbS with pleckstrin-like domain